jgi:hypothetical protein
MSQATPEAIDRTIARPVEIRRQQRRIGMRLLQVLDDRERLAEHAVVVGQRRHEFLRIHLVVRLAVMLAAVAHEVNRHRPVRNPLPRQRDAHAPGCGAPPIGEEFHGAPPCARGSRRPSTPPRTRSPALRRPTPAGVPVKNEVARFQLEPGGKLRDDLGHAPDHVGDVAFLAQLAVHLEPDAPARGCPIFEAGAIAVMGAEWSKAFRRVPGLARFLHFELHVAAREVVADRIAENRPVRAELRPRARSHGAGPTCETESAPHCHWRRRHRRAW